jgi:hypothetical protein
MTVDRSAKSNGAPKVAPPKGAHCSALPVSCRSVGRRLRTLTSVWIERTELSSRSRRPTQAATGRSLLSNIERRVGSEGSPA